MKYLERILLVFSDNEIDLREYKDGKIGPSVQIDDSFFSSLNTVYGKKEKKQTVLEGYIPDNLVYLNTGTTIRFMWFVKEGTRKIEFSDTFKQHSGDYYFPNMLFEAIGQQLYIYPYKRNAKNEIVLYNGSFPNMPGGNHLCMGSSEIKYKKKMTYEELMFSGENAIFNALFSHDPKDTWFPKMKDKKSFDYNLLKTKKCSLKQFKKTRNLQ